MDSHSAARQSGPAAPRNKVLLVNSDYFAFGSFEGKFIRRFPTFSVVSHIPTTQLDGELDALAALFVSNLAELLVVCKPGASQGEIGRARELAGVNGVDVYHISLSQDDFFVHASSNAIGDRFVWFSEKGTRMCDFQSLKAKMTDEFVNLDEL
jgi:hypothetical protein